MNSQFRAGLGISCSSKRCSTVEKTITNSPIASMQAIYLYSNISMNTTTANKPKKLQRRHHKFICCESCLDVENINDSFKQHAVKLIVQAAANKDNLLHTRIPQRMPSCGFREPHLTTHKRLKSFSLFICDSFDVRLKR